MDGLLNITTNRSTDAVAVICRVIHNSTERSTFFYLNGTELKNAHPLNVDRTVRVTQYENCFLPPSNPQEQCEELTLVLRTVDVMNNTRITCRSRPRDSPGMLQVQSPETVTVIFRDPGTYSKCIVHKGRKCVCVCHVFTKCILCITNACNVQHTCTYIHV